MRGKAHERGRAVGLRAFLVVLTLGLAIPSLASAAQVATDQVAGQPAKARKVSVSRLPDVSVAAGALVTGDGEVLWARRSADERAMASVTKVMTALVALENADLDEQVKITSAVARPGESAVGLGTGDRLTMRELLEGLLVKSGNDAAAAIAVHVGGTEAKFVEMMNARAKKLGLKHTSFANPHGLDAKNHYTSATDLAKLTREAMKNDEFRRIVALETTKVIGKTFPNTNRLLGTYPGALGVKTGHTDDAGYSMVAGAQRGDETLYAVLLGDPSDATRFEDARALLDWGFEHVEAQTLVPQGQYIGTVPVRDYLDTSVGALAAVETSATLFDLRGPVKRSVRLDDDVDAPVQQGQPLGEIVFVQDGKQVGRVELVASRHIPSPTVLERVGIAMTRAWRSVFGPHDAPQPVVVATQ